MTTQQHPPHVNSPWSDLVKYQSLIYDEKVMFLYPHGGRSVICRCFAILDFEPDVEQSAIAKSLCGHIYRKHKGEKVSSGNSSASNAISSIANFDDIPSIPIDNPKHIS
jgi:hypothetical protein